jgi:hypothetical protein
MKPSSRVTAWAWVIVAALAVPRPAVAGPGPGPDPAPATKPPPKDSAKAQAIGRAHFQRGQKLSTQGDHDGAYREFEAGYAATGRPLFLFNMAESARAAGDAVRAKDNYLEFLRIEPRSALAATAQARIADIDRASAPPEPAPPPAAPPLLPPSAMTAAPANPAGTPLPPAPPPPEDQPSFVHRWPFWVGVASVVVAGGAIAYVVSRDSGTTPACGSGCAQLNFR